jgi:hypothetical protein
MPEQQHHRRHDESHPVGKMDAFRWRPFVLVGSVHRFPFLNKRRIGDPSCVVSRRLYRCLDRDTSSLIRGFSKRILPLRVILELFRSASKVHVFQAGLFFFQEILPTRVKHHLSRFPTEALIHVFNPIIGHYR